MDHFEHPTTSSSGGNYGSIPAYDHVLEIYDFPSWIDNNDVTSLFIRFNKSVKWIDGNHFLLMLENSNDAIEVINMSKESEYMRSFNWKARSFSDASAGSRAILEKCPSVLSPPPPKPKTSSVVARRLITSALTRRDNHHSSGSNDS
eukprot:TRINITY_DN2692_c0_g1_i2.p1 TRINITY_DN2692_c0_g1~~TRINITY_DN2692_c0_g1_i2.p1  ORF type:complete len:147 (-),score=38.43 TRINITY_DN2692_c0_g1_i2:221-661(-)